MEEQGVGPTADADGAADGADGAAAVLYGIFTSFTESLDGLEERLGAIEAAARRPTEELLARLDAVADVVRSSVPAQEQRLQALESAVVDGVAALAARLDAVEAVVTARSVQPSAPSEEAAQGPPELAALVERRADALDRRMATLEAALESVRLLVQAHVDDTAHSLGRRAGEAGRRLASDLGILGRRGQPQDPPPR